jgi:hypothetical protein
MILWILTTGAFAADTGDTGDTGAPQDTAPYVDTGAQADEVYVQDVGCGGAFLLPLLGLLAAGKRR